MGFYRGVQQCAPTIGRFTHNNELQWQCWQPLVVSIPDLIKHCKTTLLLPRHEVLWQCWQEGAVPQDTRDSKIITIYKNKCKRNDCNNYRVILIRLQKLAERIYPEPQYGFRAERSPIIVIHDLLPSTVTREVQRTAYYALVHRFH